MNRQRIFWLVLVAATIWSLVMFWEASEFEKRDCSTEQGNARQACKHTSPIAALELATDPPTFRDRIDQGDPKANELWNTEIARVNTCMAAGRLTPLSWHLTPEQQSTIGKTWSDPDEQLRTELRDALGRLGCSQ